jgi:hypothetical protein
MHTLLVLLSLFGVVVMLAMGLLSVLQYLSGTSVHDEPAFREGPVIHDSAGQQRARSQFAWQSRSHFRARD